LHDCASSDSSVSVKDSGNQIYRNGWLRFRCGWNWKSCNTISDCRFLVPSLTIFHQFTMQRCFYHPWCNWTVIEHCENIYANDRVCLTRNHFYLHCERHQLLSTNPRFAPCDFNMLQSWARRLAVKANQMAVYLILALRDHFPLMSVSSSGQGFRSLLYSNGVGSYSMKIPKSMDWESVLFWTGQRLLIHITQEGCSGLSHLWITLLMRKT